jgi:ribose transport system ATP-binding protein
MLDEPTKGIDIGAKAEIYDMVRAMVRDHQLGALVVSSEEEEILTLCDFIVVMRSGVCDGVKHATSRLSIPELRRIAL